jgi:hypothetical protein
LLAKTKEFQQCGVRETAETHFAKSLEMAKLLKPLKLAKLLKPAKTTETCETFIISFA